MSPEEERTFLRSRHSSARAEDGGGSIQGTLGSYLFKGSSLPQRFAECMLSMKAQS